MNINIPTPKVGTLQSGPRIEDDDFLEKSSNDFS
jgi:hypothetical protein